MMKKTKVLQIALLAIVLTFGLATQATAQVSLGADVVSRYIFRGWDFGNAASIQPGLAYTSGGFEVGAWGNFSIVNGSANENDLYVSYSTGPVSFLLTDYYFPGYTTGNDMFFEYGDEDGVHLLELGASFAQGPFSVSGYYIFNGYAVEGEDDPIYVEVGYTPSYSVEDVELGLFLGAGNTSLYTMENEFAVINVGISASKDNISVSYILNPDQETTYLVFGYSF